MEKIGNFFGEEKKETEAAQNTDSSASSNGETPQEFFGLPKEYGEVLGQDLVNQYQEFHPEIPADAVRESLNAFSAKFRIAEPAQKEKYLKQLQDTGVSKIQKLRDILKEGAEYYDNTPYGAIREAGGAEQYAMHAYQDLQILRQENEVLKKQYNKSFEKQREPQVQREEPKEEQPVEKKQGVRYDFDAQLDDFGQYYINQIRQDNRRY